MSNASAYAELAGLREKLGACASGRVRYLLTQQMTKTTKALIVDGFRKERTPDGKQWVSRKKPYEWPILRKSGRLMYTLIDRVRFTSYGFSLTTQLPYAEAHQYGRVEINLPARQYMPEPRNSVKLPPAWQRAWDDAAERVVHPFITR